MHPDMGNYCILRIERLKSAGAAAHAARHNLREYQPENADPERAKDNVTYGAQSRQQLMAKLQERLDTVPRKIRPDAVRMVEYVITHSPESEVDSKAYLEKAGRWIAKKHGAENVLSITHHYDEATPHLHALIVPIAQTEKGPSLSAKRFFSGKAMLSALQTAFHREVGKEFGLDRGIEKSGAHHTEIKEFYGTMKKAPKIDLGDIPRRKTQEWKQATEERIRKEYGHHHARIIIDRKAIAAKNRRLNSSLQVSQSEKAFLSDELRKQQQNESSWRIKVKSLDEKVTDLSTRRDRVREFLAFGTEDAIQLLREDAMKGLRAEGRSRPKVLPKQFRDSSRFRDPGRGWER